jgi:hypothetical protein
LVVHDHQQAFLNNKMSLHFITKLHGAMDPLLVALLSKRFLHGITMFKYIKLVKISDKLSLLKIILLSLWVEWDGR